MMVVVSIVIGVAIGLAAGVPLGRWRRAGHVGRHGNSQPAERSPALETEEMAVRLSEAVEYLEVGIVLASESGKVIYRNARGSALVGTHGGLLVEDELISALAEACTGERSERLVELHGPPKLWLAITAEPVPSGVAVAMIEDVSERVRTDAMRTDFVTNISHELKTPVGAIAVLAEALADERDPEVLSRLADHLVDESHRAVSTIDDLLRLSQIEAAGPSGSAVDLSEVVRTVVETANHRAAISDAGQRVELKMAATSGAIVIRGDQRQLVSAIGNLVENAVKYSHEGDLVEVRIQLNGDAVEVLVIDQGVGIPARDLDRIFERFYRVDKARSRDTGGTGLGLAIVRHVATNHGGEVRVSSQEGAGSTFVLCLPADLHIEDGPLK